MSPVVASKLVHWSPDTYNKFSTADEDDVTGRLNGTPKEGRVFVEQKPRAIA